MTTATARRHLPALGVVLVVACAVRIAWMMWVHPDPTDGRFDDTVWYRGSAHFIAGGEGYLNPFSGTPTAGWPPGYPAFLGAVFTVAGEGLRQTYIANALIMTATVAVVYGIGVLVFDRRTALVAALALAVWPGQIYFTSLTLSEPLFTLLFALAVLFMLSVPRVRDTRAAMVVVFGLAVTAAALTRGQALLLLPVAVAAWRMSGMTWVSALRWCALAGVVVAIALSPWVVRNQRVLGSPVIISTNAGFNVWMGFHEGASGRMDPVEPPPIDRSGLTQPEYEVKAERAALREGLSYLFTHPLDDVRLAGAKLRAMYEADSTALDWNSRYEDSFYGDPAVAAWLRGAANGFWFAALVLAGVGLLSTSSRWRGPAGVLPLIILSWTALHLLFFGDSRFHYPVVFAFALLGARGVVVLYDAVRRQQPSLDRRYAPV